MSELHSAAYDGDTKEVVRLLREGAAADERDEKGFTPLLWASFRAAVSRTMIPTMKALAKAGADPNAITGPGDANCLILAAQSGSRAAVACLLSAGADVDGTADGVTALMQAARQGDRKIVDFLLQAGADPGVKCGSYTASDYARHGGHAKLAARLAAR